MTESQIKRGLRKLDKVITLEGWDSLYNLYLTFKEHSPGGTTINLLKLLAEYANRGDPVKRIRAENRKFRAGLKKSKQFTTAKRGED